MIILVGRIEIDVPDCPRVVPNVLGIPSWVVGVGIPVCLVIVIAFFYLIYSLTELRHKKAKDLRESEIEMAKQRKSCTTCGDRYEPTVSK